ncbi:MAG TPA: hypothetical protein VFE84_14300 [Patescibacteria group bacterium]|nr:hypothetical protein [Patescibacteria group bacterium]
MLIRQNAPVFGASGNILPEPGDLDFTVSYRGLHSDNHYNGTIAQKQRQELGTYVVNNQQVLDLYGSYAATKRLSFSLSVPYIEASWSVPTPISTVGPRAEQNGKGLGDVILSGGVWLFDPEKHKTGNFSVTVGCKAPTGDYKQKDDYPDIITGANNVPKVVDQSVQPGDGGWGIVLGLQGFKMVQKVIFFGSANYLANPRDTNGAPSIIVGLGFGGNPAFAGILENSVPDSYLLRTGVTFPIKGGLSGSLGFRMEGLPRYDIIGDSNGWRRPGYETFIEPGLIYSTGNTTWSIHVPTALVRNRQANPGTGNPGDATFPDYIFLAGYSYRFPDFGHRLMKGSGN